jgi:outer membrane protein assembly factor BamB
MIRKIGFIVLLLVLTLLPSHGADETFRSLEYGFSIDYPRELKTNTHFTSSVAGMDDPVLDIYVSGTMDVIISVMERNNRALDDFALMAQSRYEDKYNLTVLGTGEMEVNGSRAIFMDSLLEEELRIKDIFLQSDDEVYMISCRAEDNKFRRMNQTYFQRMMMSFRTWPVDEAIGDNLPGFPVIVGDIILSSPALEDINGDGKKEAVFGTDKGNVHAISHEGQDIPGFPIMLNDVVRSSPAIGDLDGDEAPEIAVGCDDGMLYAFEGDGSMLSGFPCQTSGAISSSPTIGDIDGDERPEIIVGSADGGIYAWHHDGSNVCGFPLITGGEVWSSPALGDLNQDGRPEIAVGFLYVCKGLVQCLRDYELGGSGGKIYSLDGNGSLLAGFPKSLSENDNIGYSSPMICDMDQDGNMEVVMAGSYGIYVKTSDEILDDYRGFPRKVEGSLADSFPAVADLNNDSKPEIVAGSQDGKLHVWLWNGMELAGFPIQTGGWIRCVTLGDIDDDGSQEILGGSTDNRVHAWRLDGTEVEGFPKVTLDDVVTAPTLDDIENDGSLELLVGSGDGQLYAWRISDRFGELAWPMMGQNLEHTRTVNA